MSPMPAEPDSDPRIGTVLAGTYRILRCLDTGGMANIYLAETLSTGRCVAIKILRSDVAGEPEIAARFEREAMAMTTLVDEHVVRLLDFGRSADGEVYLVMEYVAGESLRATLRRHGSLPLSLVLDIARQIGAALTRAHTAGIVHRDLKPENVMLVHGDPSKPRIKLLDFGMARLMAAKFAKGGALTKQGSVFGTPEYMAPEQACGGHVDARADQYALGVMLYEMLAGQRPFQASSPIDLLQMHVHNPVPSLSERAPWVPRPVGQVLERMLAKHPDARYPDVASAIVALEQAARVGTDAGGPTPVVGNHLLADRETTPAAPTHGTLQGWRIAAIVIIAVVLSGVLVIVQHWVRSLSAVRHETTIHARY